MAKAAKRDERVTQPHLFISDLDGTLLQSDVTLSERTRVTLRSMIANGLLFTVASARTVLSMRRILSGISLALPVVEMNGVFVSDLQTAAHLAAHLPAAEVAQELLARVVERNLPAFVATLEGDERHLYFSQLPNPAMLWYRDEKRTYGEPRVHHVNGLRDIENETVVSVDCWASEMPCRHSKRRFANLFRHRSVLIFTNIYCKGWWELSIQDRRATKSHAIAELHRQMGLIDHPLTVFGDNLNDLDMFHCADRTVAVANAVPAILDIAHHVTATNDDDGVALWLAGALPKAHWRRRDAPKRIRRT